MSDRRTQDRMADHASLSARLGLTVGSLFSGIGGLDLGFERAGFNIVWQCERDPFCRAVLAKHWPGIPCLEDVHDVSAESVPGINILIGGFPCQPVSCAGKRKGAGDERWLWPEFRRCIEGLRPSFVVTENVPGLRTAGLRIVLSDLAALGFDAEWSCLSACSMGAPHTRNRLFVVAYANGEHGAPWVRTAITRAIGQIQAGGPSSLPPTGQAPWLEDPSALYRGADGIPDRLDRVRAGGNAVVPQVAEVIARAILALAKEQAA